MDAENGRSAAHQPRGPLTRCLPEVPPASARLRRRAAALSRLCRGYQPTIAPRLFKGPRSRSSAKIREIYNKLPHPMSAAAACHSHAPAHHAAWVLWRCCMGMKRQVEFEFQEEGLGCNPRN